MSEAGGNKSLRWMIGTLMLALAGLGWAFAASAYAAAEEDFAYGARGDVGPLTYRRGRAIFLRNAVNQLPNAGRVVSYTLAEARWVLYVFGGLEVGAVIFGVIAWRTERGLAERDRKYAKKRRA